MRLSSPQLKDRVVAGLIGSGLNVIDIGMTTTPTFYFGVAYYGYDGGIQVSASHNPKEYNGFKMVRRNAVPVSGDSGINEIRDLCLKGEFQTPSTKGSVTHLEGVTEKAVEAERDGTDWKSIKQFKIVVDTANGMAALDIEAMFKDLPCQLVKMNFPLDGTFPVHVPDPLIDENVNLLKAEVVKQGADLGIAPDGDGDRYFFVDERGNTLRQEILRGIMAQDILQEKPGAVVGYDIRPGKITLDMILAAGGKPLVTKVGHSLIKEQMIKSDAVFGGESSGHYFYKFPFGTFEAPITLVMRFLAFLTKQNKPLSRIVAPLMKYSHSGEINSKVADVKAKVEEIQEHFKDAKISTLDGVTVEYPDYWFNVRGSNTEPLIRLNLEAKSKELMEQKRDEVLALIRS
jgi:phosphomannomutase